MITGNNWAIGAGPGMTFYRCSNIPRITQHGADEFHGAGGEMRVEERRVNWEILDAWRDAAADAGIPQDRRIQPAAIIPVTPTFR